MAGWIIRNGAPSLTVESNRVVIKSKRNVSIRVGDLLVLFSRESVFTHKAEVQALAQRELIEQSGEVKRWWEVGISEWIPLPQPVELELFSASLTFIRDSNRPTLHLRQAYRRLPDADLETIESGEPFLARETYMTLLSALPPRLSQTYGAGNAMSSRRAMYEYADRAIELIDFIEQRVISTGRQLMDAQRRWEMVSRRVGHADPLPLYAWDEDEMGQPLNLSVQADAFKALGHLPNAPDELGAPLAEIRDSLVRREQSAFDRRFEILFRDRVNERP